MIAPFTLYQPESLEEACLLLTRYGEDAKLLAGGSELILLLKLGLIRPKHIIDLKRISQLDQLEFAMERRTLTIGALISHGALVLSGSVRKHFPLLVQMEQQVANVRVRNVGTVAGNLCFAEPHADPGTLLVAYGANVKARGANGERTLKMSEFFTDYYETALQGDEILTTIEVPELGGNFTGAYLRFCPGERPLVAVALLVGWGARGAEDIRLVLGCVGPTPIRALAVEEKLRGRSAKEILGDTIEAGESAALLCDPIADLWGSKEYKRHVVRTLVARALHLACERHVTGA